MDLISIIVPVYNVEVYLARCIKSIIEQSYKNLEIILVDDGSTDNSGRICDKYRKIDDRIIVIHKINGGLSDARNAGLDICSGDYIGFCDSDDYVQVEMYKKLINFMKSNNLDVCGCGTCNIYGKKMVNSSAKNMILTTKVEIINSLFTDNTMGANVSVCTKLFKRQSIIDLRFDKGKTSEDAFFLLNWIANTCNYGYLSDSMYCYVHRINSITTQKEYNDNILDVVEAYSKNLDKIKQVYPKCQLAGERRLFWAKRIAIERTLACVDEEKKIVVVKKLQKEIRRSMLIIMKNPVISIVEKIAILLICIDVYFFWFIRKNIFKNNS